MNENDPLIRRNITNQDEITNQVTSQSQSNISPDQPPSPKLEKTIQSKWMLIAQIIILTMYLLICLGIIILFTFNDSFRDSVMEYLSRFKKLSFSHLAVLFCFTVAIKMIGFPMSVFELAVSFLLQKYFVSVLLLSSAKITGCVLSYWLGKYLFTTQLKEWLRTQKQFATLHRVAEKHPMKVSFIIRFTALPILLKNYGSPLLPFSFIQFFLPVCIHCVMKSSVNCFIGMSLRDVSDSFSSNSFADSLIFKIITAIVSIILFIGLYFLCQKEYEAMIEEMNKEEQEKCINGQFDQQNQQQEDDNQLKIVGDEEKDILVEQDSHSRSLAQIQVNKDA